MCIFLHKTHDIVCLQKDSGNSGFHFLPSANEVCEGYVFTGVCLSTVGRDLPHCMLGYTPPPLGRHPPDPQWADIPWADTPMQCMMGYGQQASSTHPTGMQSCYLYVSCFNLVWPNVKHKKCQNSRKL